MQQAASSKRLKSQLEEMKTYIKKCDVEMGHLGKAIMQRDQKLREMEIVVHNSESEKSAREHAMNEEIRALQMTIKGFSLTCGYIMSSETGMCNFLLQLILYTLHDWLSELEHATYDAQKRAELTRTLMEDIQHEGERQKEESKASVSALKHAAQEQVLSRVRYKTFSCAMLFGFSPLTLLRDNDQNINRCERWPTNLKKQIGSWTNPNPNQRRYSEKFRGWSLWKNSLIRLRFILVPFILPFW